MTNECTEFEFSMFARYEDMKSNAKCENLGGLGTSSHSRSPAMSPFERVHIISYSALIGTMCLSCAIFEL